ncbi:hypothetical protein ACFL13_03125 [Patescibacteria group bacterium]
MVNAILKALAHPFNVWVGKEGLVSAAKRLQRVLHIRIRVAQLPKKTNKLLEEGSLILAGNHPWDSEPPMLLTTLPSRKDMYFVGSAALRKIIPNFAKHLIPVHVAHHQIKSKALKPSVIFERLMNLIRGGGDLEQIRERNKTEIAKGAQKINEGGMVCIFPGTFTGKKWLTGVGWMANDVTNPNTRVVFVYIAKTSFLDYLRFIPIIKRIFPEIVIYFSAPMRIPFGKDGKVITEILRNEYYKWISTLNVKKPSSA